VAQHVLGRLSYADLPEVAVNALGLGYDGRAIRRLASLNKPSYFDVGDLFEKALVEMGIGELSKKDASVFLVKEIANEVLSGKKEPLAAAYEIWLLCWDAGCPPELVIFGGLDRCDFDIPQVLGECKTLIARQTRLDLGGAEDFPSSADRAIL
jgi:hypothetical protein